MDLNLVTEKNHSRTLKDRFLDQAWTCAWDNCLAGKSSDHQGNVIGYLNKIYCCTQILHYASLLLFEKP